MASEWRDRVETDETQSWQARSEKWFRLPVIAHVALIGAFEGRAIGGVIGGCLLGVLGTACGHFLMDRPTRLISWPLAFGFMGMGVCSVKGFVDEGAEAAMVGAFVGAVVAGIVGLSIGIVICLVAKAFRRCDNE